jgi:outer membrane lipoprotein-sorting protein
MTAETNQTPIDLLEQATAALRDSAPVNSPSPALIESTVAALESLETAPVVVVRPEARNSRSRFIRYSGLAAAAAAVVLAAVVWFIDRTAALTFAQVVENIRNARSVNFVITTKSGNKPRTDVFGGRSELEAKMAIQGDGVRYELPGAVIIFDTKERKGLELHSVDKVAEKRTFDRPEKLPADVFQNPVERLRNLKDEIKDNVEQLADETIEGRKCQVYQIKNRLKSPATWLVPDRFKLWVDVKTGLPVRIEATDENQSITYDHFVWDQPLDEKLFSLEVPQGYRLRELAPAVISADRIYVGRPSLEIKSMRPDGSDEQMQFLPRLGRLPNSFVSDKTEISPDGRYLAVAFTNTTDHGSFPPDRIYLWDRTKAKDTGDVIYARPGSELNSWQFSADGRQLYVQWWQPLHEQTRPEGRLGAEVVDLKDKTKHELKLPTFKNAAGGEETTRFMAAASDGRTFLVDGDGLQVADDQGHIERRLLPAPGGGKVRISPDGKLVLFVVGHPKDQSDELYVVPLTGGEPKSLVPAGKFTDLRARWSPDGKRIAYTCRSLDPKNPPFNFGTEASLVTVDPDGNQAVTVLNEKVDRNWGPTLELIGWR